MRLVKFRAKHCPSPRSTPTEIDVWVNPEHVVQVRPLKNDDDRTNTLITSIGPVHTRILEPIDAVIRKLSGP